MRLPRVKYVKKQKKNRNKTIIEYEKEKALPLKKVNCKKLKNESKRKKCLKRICQKK